ncbi:hypothetical protein Fmac_027216 [Flemingia macrophylla]|uniref:Uncharacterized protein n=1 Tax=Flemingia macrophylla TaxID=520843 RepID=A0ABD1LH47_9FABA
MQASAPPGRRLPPLHGIPLRARHQVHHRPPRRALQHQPLVACLRKALVQSLEVNPKPPQALLEPLHELVTVDSYVQIGLLLHHRHDPRPQRLQRGYQRVAAVPRRGYRMQRVDAVHGQGLVVLDVEVGEIEVGEVAGVVEDAELERNAHESGELLHARADFLHDAVNSGAVGPSSRGDDGGEAEMRRFVGSSGEGFEKRRPLRAVGVADVENVQLGASL